MFSRSGPPSEGASPAGASGPPEPAGSEAARAFDQILSDFQPSGAPRSAPDVDSVAAEATEHATTLRATRDAHQEAQAILAMATETRKRATEEAERIVLEARDAAERVRQELAGWAAAQRAKVDALAAEMTESANRDADAIRAEALRTSMSEAEETARLYIANAAEKARTEAEGIRGEARNVLHRATELGEEVAEAVGDLTTTVSDIMTRLQSARTSMAQLLAENRPAVTEIEEFDRFDDADEAGGADEADPGDEGAGGDELDDTEVGASSHEETEQAVDDHLGVGQLRVEERSNHGPGVRPDRQLGSMFRRHGQRGE